MKKIKKGLAKAAIIGTAAIGSVGTVAATTVDEQQITVENDTYSSSNADNLLSDMNVEITPVVEGETQDEEVGEEINKEVDEEVDEEINEEVDEEINEEIDEVVEETLVIEEELLLMQEKMLLMALQAEDPNASINNFITNFGIQDDRLTALVVGKAALEVNKYYITEEIAASSMNVLGDILDPDRYGYKASKTGLEYVETNLRGTNYRMYLKGDTIVCVNMDSSEKREVAIDEAFSEYNDVAKNYVQELAYILDSEYASSIAGMAERLGIEREIAEVEVEVNPLPAIILECIDYMQTLSDEEKILVIDFFSRLSTGNMGRDAETRALSRYKLGSLVANELGFEIGQDTDGAYFTSATLNGKEYKILNYNGLNNTIFENPNDPSDMIGIWSVNFELSWDAAERIATYKNSLGEIIEMPIDEMKNAMDTYIETPGNIGVSPADSFEFIVDQQKSRLSQNTSYRDDVFYITYFVQQSYGNEIYSMTEEEASKYTAEQIEILGKAVSNLEIGQRKDENGLTYSTFKINGETYQFLMTPTQYQMPLVNVADPSDTIPLYREEDYENVIRYIPGFIEEFKVRLAAKGIEGVKELGNRLGINIEPEQPPVEPEQPPVIPEPPVPPVQPPVIPEPPVTPSTPSSSSGSTQQKPAEEVKQPTLEEKAKALAKKCFDIDENDPKDMKFLKALFNLGLDAKLIYSEALGKFLTFDDEIISRGDFVEVINEVFKLGEKTKDIETKKTFADAGKHSEAFENLAKAGIISGHEDGTARPDEELTNVQLATIAGRLVANIAVDTSTMTDEEQNQYIESAKNIEEMLTNMTAEDVAKNKVSREDAIILLNEVYKMQNSMNLEKEVEVEVEVDIEL